MHWSVLFFRLVPFLCYIHRFSLSFFVEIREETNYVIFFVWRVLSFFSSSFYCYWLVCCILVKADCVYQSLMISFSFLFFSFLFFIYNFSCFVLFFLSSFCYIIKLYVCAYVFDFFLFYRRFVAGKKELSKKKLITIYLFDLGTKSIVCVLIFVSLWFYELASHCLIILYYKNRTTSN